MKKKDRQNMKKINPYYGFLWGFLIVLFLNGLIFPKFGRGRIVNTDYGRFISLVDSGLVKDVMIKSGRSILQRKMLSVKLLLIRQVRSMIPS